MSSYNINDNEFDLLGKEDGNEVLDELLKAFPNQKYVFTLEEDTGDFIDEWCDEYKLGEVTEHSVDELFTMLKNTYQEISSIKYSIEYNSEDPTTIMKARYTLITKELTMDKIIKFMENWTGNADFSVTYDYAMHSTTYQASLQKVND